MGANQNIEAEELWIPETYIKKVELDPFDPDQERQKVKLEPGTFIVRKVPFTIILGDPSKLPRTDRLVFEEIQIDRDSFKH
jgi:hypothetical protein